LKSRALWRFRESRALGKLSFEAALEEEFHAGLEQTAIE
jgi:hypothetical protein